MSYSHRDRRMHRQVRRWTAWFALATLGAVGAAVLIPWADWGLAALAALAVLGAVYLVRADRLVAQYVREVEAVRRGAPVSGRLAAEVTSDVGLEGRPFGPSRTSPNVRRSRREPPPGGPDYSGA